MIGLTPGQARLLAYIKRYLVEHDGVSPSIREMMVALDFKGTGAVHAHLEELTKRGAIRRGFRQTRGIEVVDHCPLHTVSTADLRAELARRGEHEDISS